AAGLDRARAVARSVRLAEAIHRGRSTAVLRPVAAADLLRLHVAPRQPGAGPEAHALRAAPRADDVLLGGLVADDLARRNLAAADPCDDRHGRGSRSRGATCDAGALCGLRGVRRR